MAKNIEEMEPSDRANYYGDLMTDNENRVAIMIYDVIDTLPRDYFSTHTLEELNEHFGGHDDLMVTENVRQYLDACREELAEIDDMIDEYEEEEEDEE